MLLIPEEGGSSEFLLLNIALICILLREIIRYLLLCCDIKLFMQLKCTVIWITKCIFGDYCEVLLTFIHSDSLGKKKKCLRQNIEEIPLNFSFSLSNVIK